MAVFVTCSCGRRFQVPETYAGNIARCPTCGSTQPIRGAGEGPETNAPDTVEGMKLRLEVVEEDVSADPRPERPRREAPARRRRSGRARRWRVPFLSRLAGWTRWVNLWVLLVPLLLGFILIVESIREFGLSSGASERPQALTLEQLAAQGPRGNNHVALTGFTPGESIVAYYRDRRSRLVRLFEGKGKPPQTWETTHVPLFVGPDRRRIVAVVVAARVRSESDFTAWRTRQEIRGMIDGKIAPDRETGTALAELYPGADLSNCYYIHEGRTPMSSGLATAWLWGGICLTLLTVLALALRIFYPSW